MPPRKTDASSEPAPAPRPVKVRATQMGYFEHKRRREGDVFWIPGERLPDDLTYPLMGMSGQKHPLAGQPHPKAGKLRYFGEWMELVDATVPERTLSSPEALRAEHLRLRNQAAPPSVGGPTGDADVLG